MKTYEHDKDYDLIIAVMDGREKAEEFFTVEMSPPTSALRRPQNGHSP